MGISERKAREKEQRRNLLIDTAERIFFERGFEVTTMAHIAEAAEFSKRTLYLYFRDKEELIFAVAARGLHLLGEALAAVPSEAVGWQKMLALLRAYFRFSMDFPNYYRATMFFETERFYFGSPPEHLGEYGRLCWQRNRDHSELAHRVLAEGLADGSMASALNPSQLTLLIWSQATGIIQVIHARQHLLEEVYDISTESLFDQFADQLTHCYGRP